MSSTETAVSKQTGKGMPDPSIHRRGEGNLRAHSPLFLRIGVLASGVHDPHILLIYSSNHFSCDCGSHESHELL